MVVVVAVLLLLLLLLLLGQHLLVLLQSHLLLLLLLSVGGHGRSAGELVGLAHLHGAALLLLLLLLLLLQEGRAHGGRVAHRVTGLLLHGHDVALRHWLLLLRLLHRETATSCWFHHIPHRLTLFQ